MKNFIKKPVFIVVSIIIIAVLIGGYFLFFRAKAPTYEFAIAQKGDVIQEVSVTGKIEPATSVDLAFETSGRISWAGVSVSDRVSVGQALAQLYNADLVAQLNSQEASLRSYQAKLDELKKGTRPEELQIYEVKVENAKISVEEAKKIIVNKIKDAYTKSDDSVRNKADQLFDNPRTSPNFKYSVSNTQLEVEVETLRADAERILTAWNSELVSLNTGSNIDAFTESAKENLQKVKTFLEKLALLTNLLTVSSSLTQTTIDAYKLDVYTGRTNVGTAIDNLATAEEKLSTAESALVLAENELVLKKAGSTPEQIKAQEALVEQAKASADNYRAQIAKTILRSPISGVITKQEAKTGEIAVAHTNVISIISDKKFEIKANVAEADIAKIKIGDTADITLDAYGDEFIFKAKVIKIDPAETVIEGVSTYKTTLEFMDEDSRIKSGLTANIDILTAQKENVISVPQRAVIEKDNTKIVRVVVSDSSSKTGERIEEIEVKTGIRGSDGNIEIIEGIKEGDKVVTFMR